MSKKNIIIIISGGLLVLAFLLFIILKQNQKSVRPVTNQPVNKTDKFQIEFLEPQEQARLNIAPDLKIQVISRTADGKVQTYKIIKNEADIIADPASLGTVSPRQGLPASE